VCAGPGFSTNILGRHMSLLTSLNAYESYYAEFKRIESEHQSFFRTHNQTLRLYEQIQSASLSTAHIERHLLEDYHTGTAFGFGTEVLPVVKTRISVL